MSAFRQNKQMLKAPNWNVMLLKVFKTKFNQYLKNCRSQNSQSVHMTQFVDKMWHVTQSIQSVHMTQRVPFCVRAQCPKTTDQS